ncbi:MAG: CDP-glucose 4,6-dehydratase [Candidatus Accumulibacter propinquus]|jgi:CDP-glucose 4,6-dehydratase
MVIQSAFWKDKRVLVTGHTGFKGSWLSLWLEGMGARVVGYALSPSTQPNFFELSGLREQLVSVLADIRDAERLRATFHDHQPEIVFHLAAQALVLPSYARPVETYSTNVMGTVNLLDAVRQTKGVRAVVIVTSDKCYESREFGPAHREGDPLGGKDPYSSSKGCAELVTAAYRSSFFCPLDHTRHGTAVATARAGNAIGGGDWSPDRLIPDAIRAFYPKAPFAGASPWCDPPLATRARTSGRLPDAGRTTVHTGGELSPKHGTSAHPPTHADRCGGHRHPCRPLGGRRSLDCDSVHPHETPCLRLDASKALSALHWQPRWSIDTALRLTVDWYRAHLSGQDMAEISRQQIGRYCRETGSPLQHER